MTRYFFDARYGPELFRDEEGVECEGVQSARDEATRALVDLARDECTGLERRELAIEVRDEVGHSLLKATLIFEMAILV